MYRFSRNPTIVFGEDAFLSIREELCTSKPLFVCDSALRAQIEKIIPDGSQIYSQISGEPDGNVVERTMEFVRSNEYDSIVGIGGGSTMDSSKLMAAAKLSRELSLRNLKDAEIIERLPLTLIPTTCGTGSEVTDMAVVKINGKKVTVRNEKLIADTAILDPSFLKSLPKEVLAYSALDALAHAIEGMMTVHSNEITDMLAKKAVELIFTNLNRAGGEKGKLLIASTLAGIVAREAKTTIGHWMAYTITEERNLPHGLSCAIPLPYAMMFNLKECEKKFVILADALEIPGGATGFIKGVRELIASVGIPTTLKEIGVEKEELSFLAKELVDEHQQRRNIKDISYENIEQLYAKAWSGDL